MMKAERRTGVILLILGIGIQFLAGFQASLHDMEIRLWQTKAEVCVPVASVPSELSRFFRQKCTPAEYFTVPYRYAFALGTVLLVSGLAVLALPKRFAHAIRSGVRRFREELGQKPEDRGERGKGNLE